MSEAYEMLIEGVPAAMIENAAKMAGMPVGPLALTDETPSTCPRRSCKPPSRPRRPQGRRSGQLELVNTLVDKRRPPRPQERQGLLRLPAEAGEEEAVAGPEGPLPAAEARRCRRRRN
jgi:3-hydroxyacyl-CoA dehydrogenase/enoyl-CoA hydratase/3-hydroxybutyryl-CoA epimerase